MAQSRNGHMPPIQKSLGLYDYKKGYTARRVLPNAAFRRFSANSANSAKFGKTKCGGCKSHKSVARGSEPFLSHSRGVSPPLYSTVHQSSHGAAIDARYAPAALCGSENVATPLDLQRPVVNSLADWLHRLGLLGNTNNFIYLYYGWY